MEILFSTRKGPGIPTSIGAQVRLSLFSRITVDRCGRTRRQDVNYGE